MPKRTGNYEIPQEKKCQGTSRQTGKPCGRRATPGSPYCKLHGSRIPKGIASLDFKDGRTSKYMPKHLMDRYNEMLSDEKLLETREEIAVAKSRVTELLQRSDTGIPPKQIKDLRSMIRSYKSAKRQNNERICEQVLTELFNLIEEDYDNDKAWDEIAKWMSLEIRLKESERRRLIENQQMVTAEEAMVLITAVAQSVKNHVQDQVIRGAIQNDLAKFVSQIGPGYGAGAERN